MQITHEFHHDIHQLLENKTKKKRGKQVEDNLTRYSLIITIIFSYLQLHIHIII